MGEVLGVLARIAAGHEHGGQASQISNCVHVQWRLFAAEAAVEIGAEADVAGIAGDLQMWSI